MIDPRTIYRLLLKLYPARFREEYGGPLERQFWDDYREAQGFRAKTWFWMQALADLGLSIPAELARELRQDVTYAARIYRQRSMRTLLALAALALAIGATTGVFSVVNTLLLRSLPFREPERLVQMRRVGAGDSFDAAVFHAWADSSPYLGSAAAYQLTDVTLTQAQGAARVKLAETSSGFFGVLGVEPEIGRPFAADEDRPGKSRVAILSHALWQQLFGSDPRVLGRDVDLNGATFRVIGIAPAGLDYPGHTAVWTPTAFDRSSPFKHGAIFTEYFGRLKPGVSLAGAQAQFRAEQMRISPQAYHRDSLNRPQLVSLRDKLAGQVRNASMVLLGVVLFVLLIACSNVAHLLLSRVTERKQELVIRAALGASRARLVQQLITECMLLTVAAAAAGMLVAHWASRLAASAQPTQLAAQEYTIVDWRVLSFAAGLAVLTGLLFGVLPASLIGRMQPAADLVRVQPGGRGMAGRRLRGALVGMQAAFTLMLLAGALTMGRSFLKLEGSDLGFRTDHVVTVSVSFTGTAEGFAGKQYFGDALDRLRAIPGIVAVGATEYLPLTPALQYGGIPFKPDNAAEPKVGFMRPTTPGYFAAMGIPILQGRDFLPSDHKVAIVSEAFTRQFPNGGNLVGQIVSSPMDRRKLRVIAMVGPERLGPGSDANPEIYLPADEWLASNLTFVARVRGKTESYVAICRDLLRGVDPRVPVFNATTLEQRLSESLARPRFYTTAIVFFGAFALLLAVIGIYGVANYLVGQRTHEIGVRLAVGAPPQQLRAMLLWQSAAPVVVGMLAGFAGAMALGGVVQHLMTPAEPIGAPACAVAAVVLSATAILAIRTATRRVLRLDPMMVLRAD
jgi:putative ABC transport system permease protein